MAEDWDGHSRKWDDDPGPRAYAVAAFASLEALCARTGVELRGATVLDFGCGTGLLSERLAPLASRVVAVDASEGMIETLRAKIAREGFDNVQAHRAVLVPASGGPGGPFDGPFDLVVCSSVCAFLEDYPGTVVTLARRIRPGGLWVQWDWELDPGEVHGFGLSQEAMRSAIGAAGLDVVQLGTAFETEVDGHVMAPLMAAGRMPDGG